MGVYLDELKDALRDLGNVAFEAVKTTVDGDQPILVGAWVSEINGQKCGCLMMDGIGTKEPWIWNEIDSTPALKNDIPTTADFLAEHFYTNEDEESVMGVAMAFDDWALWGHPSMSNNDEDPIDYRRRADHGGVEKIHVLTDEGRDILRGVMAELAAERAL